MQFPVVLLGLFALAAPAVVEGLRPSSSDKKSLVAAGAYANATSGTAKPAGCGQWNWAYDIGYLGLAERSHCMCSDSDASGNPLCGCGEGSEFLSISGYGWDACFFVLTEKAGSFQNRAVKVTKDVNPLHFGLRNLLLQAGREWCDDKSYRVPFDLSSKVATEFPLGRLIYPQYGEPKAMASSTTSTTRPGVRRTPRSRIS